jgi:hypothetical protein
MSRFHNGQLCFSISCCHRGPNTFFRISGSLTPMRRLPVAGAEDSFGVLNRVAWLRLWSQDHECCNQIFMAAPRDGCGNLFLKSPCLTNHKAFTPILSYEHREKPSTGHWPQGLTEFDLSIELAGCRTASGKLELDGALQSE